MPTVTTFEELHCAVDRYRSDKRWLFRGHASCDWKLLPKAGRTPYHGMDDRTVFQAWKRQAIAYLPNRPQDEWEWLAVAQHHGLATRLLDWSSNPLVACFFAVREPLPGDAVVYAAKYKWSVPPERKRDPMDFPDLAVFRANRIANRITSQGGDVYGTSKSKTATLRKRRRSTRPIGDSYRRRVSRHTALSAVLLRPQ